MATSSILTNVYIKEKSLAKNFIRALEIAQKKQNKNIVLKQNAVVRGEKIKKLFCQDEK